jgi:hypothetical protein
MVQGHFIIRILMGSFRIGRTTERKKTVYFHRFVDWFVGFTAKSNAMVLTEDQ